jgi:exodeoxyribonuclease-3
MKIISWNVNGIRAVERKGALDEFLQTHDPDIFLLQEIKAKDNQLSKELREHPEYHQFYHPAEKPGYAGTGIWIKKNGHGEVVFTTGMPDYDDDEGRVSRVDFQEWSVLGIYFPNGGKSPEAWEGKLVFYDHFLEYVNSLRNEGRKVVWAGDVNCAHEEIDIARPKENEGSIGFLPEERAWVTKVIENGWDDVFRKLNSSSTPTGIFPRVEVKFGS